MMAATNWAARTDLPASGSLNMPEERNCGRLSSIRLLAIPFSSVESFMMIAKAKQWARGIKRDILALWIAARDPRTPWFAKAMAAAVAAYALSPIDLIPDFIPVLGYLDDLLILPIGILLVVRMIPADLMAEFRAKAVLLATKPVSRTAMLFIIGLWLICGGLVIWFFWPVRISGGG